MSKSITYVDFAINKIFIKKEPIFKYLFLPVSVNTHHKHVTEGLCGLDGVSAIDHGGRVYRVPLAGVPVT